MKKSPLASLRSVGLGLLLGASLGAASCAGATASSAVGRSQLPPELQAAATLSVEALKAGRFDEAHKSADRVLASDGRVAQIRLVRAVARYHAAAQQLADDFFTLLGGIDATRRINHDYGRHALTQFDDALVAIDADLEAAARDAGVSLELCPACWPVDDGSERRRRRSERLLEVEEDERGERLAIDDPRRRPTFRFDLGDVYWARAAVSYQRAVVTLLLAYRWQALDAMFARGFFGGKPPLLVFPLDDPKRVTQARTLLLAGLGHAERARVLYLAETDDDREWVPSPRQKSHPLPLPVDDRLFATWADVNRDLGALLRGDDGLPLGELTQIPGMPVREFAPPRGYLDLGRLLSKPRDLQLDLGALIQALDTTRSLDDVARVLLGHGYVEKMHPSPLIQNLLRVASEITRGEESLERKLKYVFWLN